MDTPISGNLHFSRKKNCSLGRIKTFGNLRVVLLNASVSLAERQVGHDMIWWGLVVWSVSTTDGVLDLQHSRCKLNEDGWLLDLISLYHAIPPLRSMDYMDSITVSSYTMIFRSIPIISPSSCIEFLRHNQVNEHLKQESAPQKGIFWFQMPHG